MANFKDIDISAGNCRVGYVANLSFMFVQLCHAGIVVDQVQEYAGDYHVGFRLELLDR